MRLIAEPPTRIGAAAGSLYAEIPTVLIATERGGRQQTFGGCYVMRKSNLRPPDIPKEDIWHIYRARLSPIPTDADIPKLLAGACTGNTNSPPGSDRAYVPGVIGFDDKQLSDAIAAPQIVQVNKDFQISVTTSGNGCVSAADTQVILMEMSADVFVYDFTTATRPGIACTMILKSLPHNATLRFTKPGEAVIRVWGRRQGGNAPMGEPVVVEKRLKVQ